MPGMWSKTLFLFKNMKFAFIVKEHEFDGKLVLAIVDKQLLGKQILEGKKILDLKSSFYQGEEKSEEDVLRLVKKASQVNIVGKNIVSLLKQKNIIDDFSQIGGVSYAQTVFIQN